MIFATVSVVQGRAYEYNCFHFDISRQFSAVTYLYVIYGRFDTGTDFECDCQVNS